MKKIFKLCLVLALFFSCVSAAWAGLNYDSLNNFFLIDSILKTDGNYFLVGEALSGYCNDPKYLSQAQCESKNSDWIEELKQADGTNSTKFFSVSNNLIFTGNNSLFSSGSRQISNNFFSTQGITIKNSVNDLEILTNGLPLKISFNSSDLKKVLLNRDFIINNGLSVATSADFTNISPETILADTLYTNEVALLSPENTALVFGQSKSLYVAASTETGSVIHSLTVGTTNQLGQPGADKDFCVRVNWNAEDDFANYKATKFIVDQSMTPTSCGNDGGDLGTAQAAQLSCCPTNYYVFKIDVMKGKMVCCRTSAGQPLQ